MKKLILLSVIIASIVVPVRAAKMGNARAGLKSLIVQMLVVDAVYLFLLMYVWSRVN